MQYEITLPADYDLGIIERRVAERGHLTDSFAGLGLKAYLVRDGAVRQYAPFYLWADVAGMSRFLFERAGFHGIVRDFGRPVVRHWTGVLAVAGAQAGTPEWAWKSTTALPPDVDPADVVAAACAEARAMAADVHTVAIGVDPARWELVRFALGVGAPVDLPGIGYRVLHVSAPERGRLVESALRNPG